jgi:hypothetical protein
MGQKNGTGKKIQLEHMQKIPLLYHEVLAGFQEFKGHPSQEWGCWMVDEDNQERKNYRSRWRKG